MRNPGVWGIKIIKKGGLLKSIIFSDNPDDKIYSDIVEF